jgi:hypothetical protein
MLNILLDCEWWIERDEGSCESIEGRASYFASPGIPWESALEIVCDFLNFAIEFSASTTMYDLIQKPEMPPSGHPEPSKCPRARR